MQIFSNQNSNSPASATGEDKSGSNETLQLENWLPFKLFRVSTRIAEVLNAFYGPRFGLSRSAWRTMAIVANNPGVSAKEICQTGGLDQFAVSRAIKQLVELGFAQRQPGRSDRRYAAIELSEAGWSAFTDISDLARQLETELVNTVSSDELDVLSGILTKLDDASAGILARGWRGTR